jgi:hypothetical protein
LTISSVTRILVISPLDRAHAVGIAFRPSFLEEHLHQRDADHQDVGDLLADGEPGVDPVQRDDVEEEAAHERPDCDLALVLIVVELEPVEVGRGGCGFGLGHFSARVSA